MSSPHHVLTLSDSSVKHQITYVKKGEGRRMRRPYLTSMEHVTSKAT